MGGESIKERHYLVFVRLCSPTCGLQAAKILIVAEPKKWFGLGLSNNRCGHANRTRSGV
jgi:hypothetical protein